jgi:DNA-binding HxlR family transcriptional regulator
VTVSPQVSNQVKNPVSTQVSNQARNLLAETPHGIMPSACPSRVILDHVTGKWGVLILVVLPGRSMRWSELRRAIQGISEKMLAQTLQTLERDGLVLRTALPVIPPHVEYSLTDLGAELVERLLPLMDWLLINAGAMVDGSAAAAAGPSAAGPSAPVLSIQPGSDRA